MKIRILLILICYLLAGTIFTSCSKDDDKVNEHKSWQDVVDKYPVLAGLPAFSHPVANHSYDPVSGRTEIYFTDVTPADAAAYGDALLKSGFSRMSPAASNRSRAVGDINMSEVFGKEHTADQQTVVTLTLTEQHAGTPNFTIVAQWTEIGGGTLVGRWPTPEEWKAIGLEGFQQPEGVTLIEGLLIEDDVEDENGDPIGEKTIKWLFYWQNATQADFDKMVHTLYTNFGVNRFYYYNPLDLNRWPELEYTYNLPGNNLCGVSAQADLLYTNPRQTVFKAGYTQDFTTHNRPFRSYKVVADIKTDLQPGEAAMGLSIESYYNFDNRVPDVKLPEQMDYWVLFTNEDDEKSYTSQVTKIGEDWLVEDWRAVTTQWQYFLCMPYGYEYFAKIEEEPWQHLGTWDYRSFHDNFYFGIWGSVPVGPLCIFPYMASVYGIESSQGQLPGESPYSVTNETTTIDGREWGVYTLTHFHSNKTSQSIYIYDTETNICRSSTSRVVYEDGSSSRKLSEIVNLRTSGVTMPTELPSAPQY